MQVFGTPNHRTRYYLVAELSDRFAGNSALPTSLSLPEELSDDDTPQAPTSCYGKPAGLLATGPWASRFRLKVGEAHLELSNCDLAEGSQTVFAKLRSTIISEFQHRAATSPGRSELASTSTSESMEMFSAALSELVRSDDWPVLPYLQDGLLLGFPLHGRVNQEVARSLLPELQKIFDASIDGNPADDAASWSWLGDSTPKVEARSISEFLDADLSGDALNSLLLPEAVLQKPFARGLSYVRGVDRQSFCFTGHYGKVLHKSSGSLLHNAGPEDTLDRNNVAASAQGKIRFFSPKEILNFLGFPRTYVLPDGIERRHCYKAVGNSIAVSVAAELLQMLLFHEGEERLDQLSKSPPLRSSLPASE